MTIQQLSSSLNQIGYRVQIKGKDKLEIEVSDLKGCKKTFQCEGKVNDAFFYKIAAYYNINQDSLF